MKKIRSSKKGFTLAELLIVVAIIGVLVGISIPIFTTQLAKSRLATNQANARAAKAAAVAAYLAKDDGETVAGGTYNAETGAFTKADTAPTTTITGDGISGWTTTNQTALTTDTYDTWTVALDANGAVTGYGYSNS